MIVLPAPPLPPVPPAPPLPPAPPAPPPPPPLPPLLLELEPHAASMLASATPKVKRIQEFFIALSPCLRHALHACGARVQKITVSACIRGCSGATKSVRWPDREGMNRQDAKAPG